MLDEVVPLVLLARLAAFSYQVSRSSIIRAHTNGILPFLPPASNLEQVRLRHARCSSGGTPLHLEV